MRASCTCRPQTVVMLTRSYPPGRGGMQRWSFQLSQALAAVAARRGATAHAVHVWAPPRFLAGGPPLLALAGLVLRGIGRVATVGQPVALVHLGDAALAPAAPLLRAALRCHVTATVHGLDATYSARWYQALVRPALRSLDAVIAVSQATAAACRARGIPVRAVIPNGVDVGTWAARPDRALARRALGLDDGAWLLSVGRLVRRKGLAWFVGAVLPRLAHQMPRLRLLIIGDGPERPWIAAAARVAGVAERVRLAGAVSDGALALAYGAADVLVMPNLAIAGDPEGFGLVALEAAAAGLPVLASAVDGIPEAVNGTVGRLVAPGDVAAWVTELRALLEDERQRLVLGARARAHVEAHCTWQAVAARYWELFDEVLKGAGRRV